MRNKVFILSLMLLIIPLTLLFAGGLSEGRLVYLPRDVVNNSNIMIEMTQAKRLNSSTLKKDFSNGSDDNLALFRLRDSLFNKDQSSTDGLVVTITSDSNWQFVHESNPTSRVDFELNAFCVERKNQGRDYNSNVSIQELGENTTLSKSSAKSYFKKVGSAYKLLLPYTGFSRDLASFFADYMREFDVCVVLPSDVDVEPGYYTTHLTVTTEAFQEHSSFSGGTWLNPNISGNKDGQPKTITEEITVRGYVGVDPGLSSGSYSFFISSSDDTYSMNLALSRQEEPYVVANIQFLKVDIVNNKPNESTQKTKYTIYISPTNVYNVGGTGTTSDPMEYRYKFIRIGSENQARTDENTIYYDLYLKTSSNGYTALKECGTSTLYADGYIGSAGIYSNSVKTTFKILPEYEPDQISKSGLLGGKDEYKETWRLDQDLYLKLTSESMAAVLRHQPGIYYSNIYFTMVSN